VRASRTFWASVALLLLAPPALAGVPGSGDADLATARSAVENGLDRFALGPLERLHADESFHRRDEATLLLARAYLRLGRPGDAARVLSGYEEEFPESSRLFPEAAYRLARADLARAGRPGLTRVERERLLERARRGFERTLKETVDPALLAGSRFFLSMSLTEAGRHEEALTAFRRADELGVPPSERDALAYYLGHCELRLGNFSEAAKALEEAAERLAEHFPKSDYTGKTLYELGEAHYYLEEWAGAAGAYSRAVEWAEGRGREGLAREARYARGWALSKLAERTDQKGDDAAAREARVAALADFEALRESGPGSVRDSSAFRAAEILLELGRHERAAESLIEFTDHGRYPNHAAAALYLLGRAREVLGQLEEAASAYRRALDGAGARGGLARDCRVNLAGVLVELGHPDRARDVILPLALPTEAPSVRADALFEMARVGRLAAALAREKGDPGATAGFFEKAHESLAALASDPALMAEVPSDEVLYWTGRSADDRARLASDPAAREEWIGRAVSAYREARAAAEWGPWAEKALRDEAGLALFAGDVAGAARAYRELLGRGKLAPEVEVAARLRLADAELERARPAEAAAVLEPLLSEERLAAGRAEAVYKKGVALLRQGEFESAERSFRSFLGEYARHRLAPDARAGLGECLSALGRHGESAAEYERVLAEHPGYRGLGRVTLAAGEERFAEGATAEAAAHYRALFGRGGPPDLRARARLGEARVEGSLGRTEAALALATEAASVGGLGRVAREAEELRGRMLLSLRRYEEAVEAFGRAAEDPDPGVRARALFEQATALGRWGRSGELADTIDVLERAARAFTRVSYEAEDQALAERAVFAGAEAIAGYAAALESKGRPGEAEKELEEALDLLRRAEDEGRAAARSEEIELRLERLGRRR
jgi:tetratricopeptide (TPR) repeat protein